MTMPTRYVRGPDGGLVAVPTPITPPEEAEEKGDGISDLFEAPGKEDVADIFDVSDESEVSEEDVIGGEEEDPELTEEDEDYLFGVSEEDVMGEAPKPPEPPELKTPRLRRAIKRYPPPPTTLGGMRT